MSSQWAAAPAACSGAAPRRLGGSAGTASGGALKVSGRAAAVRGRGVRALPPESRRRRRRPAGLAPRLGGGRGASEQSAPVPSGAQAAARERWERESAGRHPPCAVAARKTAAAARRRMSGRMTKELAPRPREACSDPAAAAPQLCSKNERHEHFCGSIGSDQGVVV